MISLLTVDRFEGIDEGLVNEPTHPSTSALSRHRSVDIDIQCKERRT